MTDTQTRQNNYPVTGIRHFPHPDKLRMNRNHQFTPFEATRALIRATREFTCWDFRYTLLAGNHAEDIPEDHMRVDIRAMEHENIPRILEETMRARFGVEASRGDSYVDIPRKYLEGWGSD